MAAFSAGKTEYRGIRDLTPQLLWVRNLAGGPCLYFRLRISSNSKNAFCLVSGVYAGLWLVIEGTKGEGKWDEFSSIMDS